VFKAILNSIAPEFALDLGSHATHVYLKGKGIVASEASCVAIHEREGESAAKVIAVGNKAKALRERTSASVRTSEPFLGGAVQNLHLAEVMLREFIAQVMPRSRMVYSKVVLSVPSDATQLEERALVEAAEAACNGHVYSLPRQLAAAIGTGLKLSECKGSMLVDIGAAQTNVAVVSLDGLVVSDSIRLAGNYFDQLIVEHVRRTHGLLIGTSTGEVLKKQLLSATSPRQTTSLEVQGRSVRTGLPGKVSISALDVYQAVKPALPELVELIQKVLDKTPPEIAADLYESGAIIIGGGALIPEIDTYLSAQTGLVMSLVEEPQTSVVFGCGQVIENWREYQHLLTAH
jgi:rod shape-determining protein MreB